MSSPRPNFNHGADAARRAADAHRIATDAARQSHETQLRAQPNLINAHRSARTVGRGSRHPVVRLIRGIFTLAVLGFIVWVALQLLANV